MSEKKTIMAWITKYALTQGIFTKEVEICYDETDLYLDMVVEVNPDSMAAYFHKSEWWETREDAVKQAEKMRKNKIDSLMKAIKKLENLKF